MVHLDVAAMRVVVAFFCSLFLLTAAFAHADAPQVQAFDIVPQGLSTALDEFARQSRREILFAPEVARQRNSNGVRGTMEPLAALQVLLAGSGLSFATTRGGAILVGAPDRIPPAVRGDQAGSGAEAPKRDEKAGRSFSDRFQVAQVDQGAPSGAHIVANNSGTDASANGSSASLVEIVVTAEKLSVDVMHAPVSLTALNGDTLQRNEIHQVADLQFYVPGLSISNAVAGISVNIRGVGSTFTSPNIAQGVPIYRDGLLVPTSIGDEPLWDVANVQVLRGPQGTLVGANSTAGAMFVNTVNPVLGDQTTGYAQVVGGNYHRLVTESAVNLPIADTIAARLGMRYERRDSYSDNLTANDFNPGGGVWQLSNRAEPGALDMISVRASLLWEPSGGIRLLGKVEYFESSNGYQAEKPIPVASTSVNGVTTNCPAPGSYFHADPATWGQVPGTCGFAPFAPANPYQVAYGANDTAQYERIWRESLEAKFALGDRGPTLRLLGGASYNTSSFQGENTASPYYTGGFNARTSEHTITVEGDLLSRSDGAFQWVVGGFWWDDPSTFIYAPVNFSGGPFGVGPGYSQPTGGLFLDGENERKSYAAFGNVSYQFDTSWKLEAGIRETWNRGVNNFVPCPVNENSLQCYKGDANAFHFLNPNPSNPWGPMVYGGGGFPNLGAESDSLFSWKVAVDYNLTAKNYLYAEVATGGKAGGIRTNVPGDNFDPEKDTDFELGWKATMFQDRVSVQLDGFYTDYTNMQIRGRNISDGQGSIFNAGSAKIYGVEFATQAMLGGWQLAGTASYTKSSVSIGDIVNQDACNLEADCANNNTAQCPPGVGNGTSVNGHPCFNYQTGGATINGKFYPFLENVSGQQLPNSPKFQGNISVAYRLALADAGLTPRLDLSYQDKQYMQIYNTPLDLFPSRTNLSAKLSYDHGNWLVEGYVTNLTNQAYPVATDINANNTELFNAPREFGVRVRRSW